MRTQRFEVAGRTKPGCRALLDSLELSFPSEEIVVVDFTTHEDLPETSNLKRVSGKIADPLGRSRFYSARVTTAHELERLTQGAATAGEWFRVRVFPSEHLAGRWSQWDPDEWWRPSVTVSEAHGTSRLAKLVDDGTAFILART